MPKLPKLVWAEWIDSSSQSGWHSSDELNDSGLIRSVGWLMSETKELLVLAVSWEEHENVHQNFCSVMTIPKGAIRAWGELITTWN